MKKQLVDNWGLKYRGVSVWHYFRFVFNDFPQLPYRRTPRISLRDSFAFIRFLGLRWKQPKDVVFIAARGELVNLVEGKFGPASEGTYDLFLRDEGGAIAGNSALIEALRFFFRKLAFAFDCFQYIDICGQLEALGNDDIKIRRVLRNVIGDYWFNRFLSVFLSKHRVWYTNCVIPMIERYQGLYWSCELQHGVVHENHLDYCDIPRNLIRNRLYVWSDHWRARLLESGYQGPMLVADKLPFPAPMTYPLGRLAIFSTVTPDFRQDLDRFLESYDGSGGAIFVQAHPRDLLAKNQLSGGSPYIKHVRDQLPLNFEVPIMHDTTLIIPCLIYSHRFYYYAPSSESDDEIKQRLSTKYGAEYGTNYEIIRDLRSAVIRLARHASDSVSRSPTTWMSHS